MFATRNSGKPEFLLYYGRSLPLQPPRDFIYNNYAQNGLALPGYQPRKEQHHYHQRRSRERSRSNHRRRRSRERRMENEERTSRDSLGISSGRSGRGKMTTGCQQFLKYANLLFTFIVFIAGAGILGLGIYILGSDYGAQQVSEALGDDLYLIAAYVLIASGGVLVIVSMCGCCGALRESRIMLGIMEGDIIHSMENVLIDKYGVDLAHHSDNRMATDWWNWLQRELKCCGVTGGVNSTTSWAIYRHTTWYKGFETGKPYVPQSCCDPEGDLNDCSGYSLPCSCVDGWSQSTPFTKPNMRRWTKRRNGSLI
ncbi:TSN9-like protein [Mya arenaria]|uniref:TSN9-like protein n=1 Tax=Mya arenaria TaxID=6604 RepID=A0ABY7FU82_MYAAR|nr:TSN9-like protein [Mya arenaria]